jgi:hypothetical protein
LRVDLQRTYSRDGSIGIVVGQRRTRNCKP